MCCVVQGSLLGYCIMTYMGKESKRVDMYNYSLCCTIEMQYSETQQYSNFFKIVNVHKTVAWAECIGGCNDKGDKWLKNHHLHSPPPSLILPACHFPCLSPCGGNQGAGSPITFPMSATKEEVRLWVQILKSLQVPSSGCTNFHVQRRGNSKNAERVRMSLL